MDKVRRIYVEKKPAYAVEAKALLEDIRDYLGIKSVTNVRVMNRYDIENLSEDVLATAKTTVFSEPPVDYLYEEVLPEDVRGARFYVEYLPGQFDQRADSAQQCVNLLAEDEEPVIRSAKTYIIEGDVTAEDMEKIKAFCINPVDSRESK